MNGISASLGKLAGTDAGADPAAKTESQDPLTNKDTFLRLLVAQLQNQSPLDPSDPIEFVTQLTQFSSLEQALGTRDELRAIHSTLEDLAQRLAPAAPQASTLRTD